MIKALKRLYEDAKNICEKDPACRNVIEAIILYPRISFNIISQNSTFFIQEKTIFLSKTNIPNIKTHNRNRNTSTEQK